MIAETEPMVTTSPVLREAMCGTAAWTTRSAPNALASNVSCSSARGRSSSGATHCTPALFTMMSILPSLRTMDSTAARTLASSVTSIARRLILGRMPFVFSRLLAVA
jgi:hypothetical protein